MFLVLAIAPHEVDAAFVLDFVAGRIPQKTTLPFLLSIRAAFQATRHLPAVWALLSASQIKMGGGSGVVLSMYRLLTTAPVQVTSHPPFASRLGAAQASLLPPADTKTNPTKQYEDLELKRVVV